MTPYTVQVTESAEVEVDRLYMRLGRYDPETAHRWYAGLVKAFASLSTMPGRCAIARESAATPDVTVRQLLYGKHRVLFHIREPAEEGEGVVRILHVLHGAQGPPAGETDAG